MKTIYNYSEFENKKILFEENKNNNLRNNSEVLKNHVKSGSPTVEFEVICNF